MCFALADNSWISCDPNDGWNGSLLKTCQARRIDSLLRPKFVKVPPELLDRFDLEFIGNPQLFARAIVIESLHPVHDQALLKALQCEILSCRAAVVRMRH